MKGYYVIEFNDQEQKDDISASLSKTTVEYRLVLNLKKFVAEKCNVTIIDNVPPVQHHPSVPIPIIQSSNATANRAQIAMSPSINVAPPNMATSQPASEVPTNHGVALPPIDTIKAEPQDINPFSPEPVNIVPVAAPQPNSSNSNRNHDRPSWMHQNYQGTYPPFGDMPIVPKVEIVDLSDDEEQEVKPRNMEEQVEEQIDGVNDGLNEHHVEEAAEVPNVVGTPPPLGRQNREVAAPKNSVRNVRPQKNVPMANHVNSPSSSSSANKKVKNQKTDGKNGDRQKDTNGTDDIAADDTSIPNQEDVPSSSTARKSGRTTKRLNYATIGDENVEGDTNPKKGRVEETEELEEGESRMEGCRKCGTKVQSVYGNKLDHAMLHTDIGGKYECMIDQCGYTTEYGHTISHHMRTRHPSQSQCFKDFQLNRKQTDELNIVMQKCFTDPDNSSDDNCKLCNQHITTHPGSFTLRTEHAYNHLPFTMYKCLESECSFKSKTVRSMNGHHRVAHGKPKGKSSKIIRVGSRKLEIENMVATCFPNLKRN